MNPQDYLHDEKYVFTSAKPLNLLLIFGVIFFVTATVVPMGLSTYFCLHNNITAFCIMLGCAIVFGYMSHVGFILLKFLKITITMSNSSISIDNNKETKTFNWSSALKVKDSESIQIFQLFDESGTRIFMVDYYFPRFNLISSIIKGKIANPQSTIDSIINPVFTKEEIAEKTIAIQKRKKFDGIATVAFFSYIGLSYFLLSRYDFIFDSNAPYIFCFHYLWLLAIGLSLLASSFAIQHVKQTKRAISFIVSSIMLTLLILLFMSGYVATINAEVGTVKPTIFSGNIHDKSKTERHFYFSVSVDGQPEPTLIRVPEEDFKSYSIGQQYRFPVLKGSLGLYFNRQ